VGCNTLWKAGLRVLRGTWAFTMAPCLTGGAGNRSDGLHRDEILPGTLYLLILKTLARSGEMHGYEIANSIQRISQDVLQVEEGSLYPALQRMLIKGWVTAEWGTTADNRRARYYRLTAAGRKQLEVEMKQFERVIGAITRVIEAV